MHRTHQQFLESYTMTFPPATIRTWSKAVEDWEADMSKPNPYRECQSRKSPLCPSIILDPYD